MRKFKQEPVRFDESELKTNLGTGNFIFVGSGTDLFAPDIKKEWITKTLNHCQNFKNKYLFQTKNPSEYFNFAFPQNSVFGVTLESNRFYPAISDAPDSLARVKELLKLRRAGKKILLTIEPILKFDLKQFADIIQKVKPEMVAIGADSGKNFLPEPSKKEISDLIFEIKNYTKINLKQNLQRLIK